MFNRWLIRTLCLLPLACVVAVWTASYFGFLFLHQFAGHHYSEVAAVQGLVLFNGIGANPNPDSPLNFDFYRASTAQDMLPVPTTLGFYGGIWPGIPDSLLIIFPLWLPTLLLAALNWFVWRKTRPPKPGRGFPVEPT